MDERWVRLPLLELCLLQNAFKFRWKNLERTVMWRSVYLCQIPFTCTIIISFYFIMQYQSFRWHGKWRGLTIGSFKSFEAQGICARNINMGSKLSRTKDKDAILDGSNFIVFKLWFIVLLNTFQDEFIIFPIIILSIIQKRFSLYVS